MKHTKVGTRLKKLGNHHMKHFLKVYIAKADNLGNGLFAKKNIKKDEVIFITKGVVEKGSYDPKLYDIGPNWLAIAKNTWLSPFNDNPWRYINHSCNPNTGLKGQVTVVAMKNIRKDQWITIDYSITEADPYWKMRCMCKQKNCRKIIRSIRFLPSRLFEKYKKYIPKFLKDGYLSHRTK
ncbi:MAG: SET domain-containing protein-lysine N-methyltransferase [Patescibacteria group bacterium]